MLCLQFICCVAARVVSGCSLRFAQASYRGLLQLYCTLYCASLHPWVPALAFSCTATLEGLVPFRWLQRQRVPYAQWRLVGVQGLHTTCSRNWPDRNSLGWPSAAVWSAQSDVEGRQMVGLVGERCPCSHVSLLVDW